MKMCRGLTGVLGFLLILSAAQGLQARQHLRPAEVELLLAKMGDSRERAFEALLTTWEISETTATILLKHCLDPQNPEAILWAQTHWPDEQEITHEGIAAAYIAGQNETPPIGAQDRLRKDTHIYVRLLKHSTMGHFAFSLDQILGATYPITRLQAPQEELVRSGLRQSLSEDGIGMLKEYIDDSLAAAEAHPASPATALNDHLAFAYIHQTGDVSFLEQLLNSSNEWNNFLGLRIGILAENPNLVKPCIRFLEEFSWPDTLPAFADEGEELAFHAYNGLGMQLLRRQKHVHGAGDLLLSLIHI